MLEAVRELDAFVEKTASKFRALDNTKVEYTRKEWDEMFGAYFKMSLTGIVQIYSMSRMFQKKEPSMVILGQVLTDLSESAFKSIEEGEKEREKRGE